MPERLPDGAHFSLRLWFLLTIKEVFVVILKKQPTHVPDWVWGEYQQALDMKDLAMFEISKAARPELSDEERDIKARIIFDHECGVVWPAIGRLKKNAKDVPDESHALWLFANAKRFFLGPSELDSAARSERKKLGEKVAKLATDLQSTLSEVYKVGQVPLVIEESLAAPFQQLLGLRVSVDHPNTAQWLIGKTKHERALAVALRGASREAFFAEDSVNVLASLARGANAHA